MSSCQKEAFYLTFPASRSPSFIDIHQYLCGCSFTILFSVSNTFRTERVLTLKISWGPSAYNRYMCTYSNSCDTKHSSSLLRLHGHQIRKLRTNSMIYLYNQQICVGSLYVICFSDRLEKCLTESFLYHNFRYFRIATLKFFLHKIKLILYHSSTSVLIKTFAHTVKMCLTCFWGIMSIDTISMFRSTFVFIRNIKFLSVCFLIFSFGFLHTSGI